MKKPYFTMPEQEQAYLIEQYQKADTILEYGSGGSTIVAAEMPGKHVMSVESDPKWIAYMQKYIDATPLPSKPILHHVDIGNVVRFGRPADASKYRDFPNYPLDIWDQDFFRQPDVVLVDGRARAGCLLATYLRTRSKVTVLFDDYIGRDRYKMVEEIVKPDEIVGRMAVFHLEPTVLNPDQLTTIARSFVSVQLEARPLRGRFRRFRDELKASLSG